MANDNSDKIMIQLDHKAIAQTEQDTLSDLSANKDALNQIGSMLFGVSNFGDYAEQQQTKRTEHFEKIAEAEKKKEGNNDE